MNLGAILIRLIWIPFFTNRKHVLTILKVGAALTALNVLFALVTWWLGLPFSISASLWRAFGFGAFTVFYAIHFRLFEQKKAEQDRQPTPASSYSPAGGTTWTPPPAGPACPGCGSPIAYDARFCGVCGRPARPHQAQDESALERQRAIRSHIVRQLIQRERTLMISSLVFAVLHGLGGAATLVFGLLAYDRLRQDDGLRFLGGFVLVVLVLYPWYYTVWFILFGVNRRQKYTRLRSEPDLPLLHLYDTKGYSVFIIFGIIGGIGCNVAALFLLLYCYSKIFGWLHGRRGRRTYKKFCRVEMVNGTEVYYERWP